MSWRPSFFATFTGAVQRVGTWRHLRLPRSIIGQRNQRQIAFSISWTRQEPRGSVGSSVISDPAVPGSNSTAVNSLILSHFFSQSEDSKNFKVFHMNGDGLRTCAPVKSIKTSQQVFIGFKNLPTGYYRKLKTSGQSKCSNGRLAIETSVKSIISDRNPDRRPLPLAAGSNDYRKPLP